MSSRGMPLTTRCPTNGGTNTGLSVGDLGRARRQALDRRRVRVAPARAWGPAARVSRPKPGRPRPCRLSSPSRSITRSPSKASLP